MMVVGTLGEVEVLGVFSDVVVVEQGVRHTLRWRERLGGAREAVNV